MTTDNQDNGSEITCAPPATILRMINASLQWFLPPTQRQRFLTIGEDYSYLDAHEWENLFQIAKVKLNKVLLEMKARQFERFNGDWMSLWDDEVFFFYILRFQFIWIRLHQMSEKEMIPCEWDDFWTWGMTPREEEIWLHYTAIAKAAFLEIDPKPEIWDFFAPKDIEMEPRG